MESMIFLPKKYFYKLIFHEDCKQSLKSFGCDLFLKLGTNNIDKQGDIIVTLISSNKEKKKLQSCDAVSKFMENFLRKQPQIAGYEAVRDLSYKIKVKRSLCFQLALSSTFKPDIWLKSNHPKSNFDIRVTLINQSESSSVSHSRCLMIGKHIENLFQMACITVNVNIGLSTHSFYLKNEETSMKCSLQQECTTNLSSGIKLNEEKKLKNVEENKLTIGKLDLKYIVESNWHSHCEGAILLCSPIISQRECIKLRTTSNQYISLLEDEISKASMHKYGDISSKSWKEFISNAARNCQILQFMSVTHLSPIKVDLNKDSSNSRAGAFVLYNYARISMLLKNLQILIDKNLLPPIPPSSSIDFSLLKHQEEWELCWIYISRLPELLYDILDEMINLGLNAPLQSSKMGLETDLTMDNLSNLLYKCKPNVKTKTLHFPTHKVAKFLHNLSHCWSVYYNRVHILPSVAMLEKEPMCHVSSHLISTLWARIYLVKAVQTTIDICFKTLDIVPPQKM